MLLRLLLGAGAAVVAAVLAVAVFSLKTHQPLPLDPAWAVAGDDPIPAGALTVRFTGTSTLLFSDGETDWMVDGWFSRFGPIELTTGPIGPDVEAIERGLARNAVDRLAVVIPIHSHFDHAMDAPEVARRTGALLLGSESTAWIGRGWGLDERQIRVAEDRRPLRFGAFTITLIETDHFVFPDPEVRARALGEPRIEAPLVPPVDAFDYRVGQPYAIHVAHPMGRFLIQGSAGFRPDGLAGFEADTVFLGVGGLGTQTADYREQYWHETVALPGARRVIPIHFDSLTASIEGPFVGEVRAASLLSSGDDRTRAFLEEKLAAARSADPGFRILTLPRYDPVVLYR
jgi:L-ascorbate metabolism protein UlaG (beta-lactamase superfamily)